MRTKLCFALFVAIAAFAFTGGEYTLDQSVTANGGGLSIDEVNNLYKVEGKSGQSVAGDALKLKL